MTRFKKSKSKKRAIGLVFGLAVLISAFAMSVFAEETNELGFDLNDDTWIVLDETTLTDDDDDGYYEWSGGTFSTDVNYYLDVDIELTGVVYAKADFTLYLNDHVIIKSDQTSSKQMFYTNIDGSSINIYDDGDTVRYGAWNDTTTEYSIISQDDYSKLDVNAQEAYTELVGGVIAGGYYSGGSAICVLYTSTAATLGIDVNVDGVTFAGNRATGDGGAIKYSNYKENSAGSLTVENSTFVDNTATGDGGAIYAYSYNGVTIDNCSFVNNSATTNNTSEGGAIYLYNYYSNESSPSSISNSIFSENTAYLSGGAICTYGYTILNMDTITVDNNFTNGDGGGIYIGLNTTATLTNSTITNNSTECASNDDGGGITVYRSTFTMDNTAVSGNTAYSGGGVYVVGTSSTSYSTVAITNSEISNNYYMSKGGGVYLAYGYDIVSIGDGTTITGNKPVDGNTLTTTGGGIQSTAKLTLGDVTITGNESSSYAGGVYVNSTITLDGTVVIKENTATGTTQNNSYLYTTSTVYTIGENFDDENSEVHVSVNYALKGFNIATGTDISNDVTAGFVSDDTGYQIASELSSGYVVIEHAHSITYSASGAVITVDCDNNIGSCDFPSSGYKITVVKPEATTYGSADSFEATITLSDDDVKEYVDTDSITITYKEGETTLNSAPTDAGTYTASITVEGQTASVEYTIAQASSSVVITDITSTTYENDITITATVSCVNGENPTGTVTFYNDETELATVDVESDGTATYTMTSPVADKYSITAEFTSSDDNYSDSKTESATTFDIEKATQTIEITAVTGKEYNDADFTLSITGQKDDGTVTYSVLDDNGVVTITGDTVTIIGAGTVTITATVDGDNNYNGDSTTYDLTIAKDQAPIITFPTSSDITYGDTLADSTLTDSSVYGTFAWTESNTIPTVSNDGYEVTFTASADTIKNYETIEDITATVDVTVAKKEVTVVIDDVEIVRGMDIPTLTGTVDGDIITDVVVPTYSVTADNTVAGEYTITMTNADDYVNYDIVITNGTLKITDGYTVSFDDVDVTDIAYGTTVSQPEDPTKDGYIFLGWYLNGEEFDFETLITEDLEITSVWEEVVEKEIEVTGNADITIEAEVEEQLLAELFTKEEIALNVEMKVSVNVDIVVIEDMDETAQAEFNSYLDEYNASLEDGTEAVQAIVFDISVIKSLAGVEENITNLDTPITITIAIPEEYQADGREFFILRNHDGEITILEDLDDDPTTITIETDCFSNYTLNYIDVETDTDTDTDEDDDDDDVVQTGANSSPQTLIVIMFVSLLGLFVVSKKRLVK